MPHLCRQRFVSPVFLCFLFLAYSIQTVSGQVRPGFVLRIYPAGQILGVQLSVPSGDRNEFRVFSGYNRTRRRDWGRHDNERGGGWGAGVGFLRFTSNAPDSWFYGIQSDLWFLDIDWRNDSPASRGTSSVTVFQPAVTTGYRFTPGRLRTDLSLSLGSEFNIRTSGEAVGEGLILLGGLRVQY